jgi:hypothetical protein
MEMSQGNSLHSYFNKQKYLFCFIFYKIKEQEDRTGPPWGVSTSETGEDVGKKCRRVIMVQILCIHVCKWKNETS